MKKNRKCLLAFAIGFMASSVPAFADERAEIKQRIEALRVEAKELASHGKEEEASNRMKQVRELMGKLKGMDEPQSDAPRGDQHRVEGHRAEREEMLHRLSRRLEHMRAAIQHLKEGDLPDMAHELARRAEELESHLRKEKEAFGKELNKHSEAKERSEKMPLITAQQDKPQLVKPRQSEEQEAWGARVKEELTRHAETIGDVRSEQEKMRRELKELRSLIERMTSEVKGKEQSRKDSGGRD
jgi:chromosome segregation ATPase